MQANRLLCAVRHAHLQKVLKLECVHAQIRMDV